MGLDLQTEPANRPESTKQKPKKKKKVSQQTYSGIVPFFFTLSNHQRPSLDPDCVCCPGITPRPVVGDPAESNTAFIGLFPALNSPPQPARSAPSLMLLRVSDPYQPLSARYRASHTPAPYLLCLQNVDLCHPLPIPLNHFLSRAIMILWGNRALLPKGMQNVPPLERKKVSGYHLFITRCTNVPALEASTVRRIAGRYSKFPYLFPRLTQRECFDQALSAGGRAPMIC